MMSAVFTWLANLFPRLAGSKVWSAVNLVIGLLATVCLTMADQVEAALGADHAKRACAIIAIVAFLGTSLGQGLASRRPGHVDAGMVAPMRASGTRKFDRG
jgi:drug/metabolite transporter (DMT)-like permease